MNPFDELSELLKEFPGVGPRQAKRFAYFLLSKDKGYLTSLSSAVMNIKNSFSQCLSCMRFFKKTGREVCNICEDSSRNHSELLIVSKDIDFENIEKSGAYTGSYFVLGGLLSLTSKDSSKNKRMENLREKIKKNSDLKNIIFALSATTEGDHTEDILVSELRNLFPEKNIEFLRLGKGISTGVELEYADKDTISGALKNKTPVI